MKNDWYLYREYGRKLKHHGKLSGAFAVISIFVLLLVSVIYGTLDSYIETLRNGLDLRKLSVPEDKKIILYPINNVVKNNCRQVRRQENLKDDQMIIPKFILAGKTGNADVPTVSGEQFVGETVTVHYDYYISENSALEIIRALGKENKKPEENMYIEECHQAILDWLNEYGSISNVDIQKKFGVSYESAKRDLRILEEKGLLKRTHGGALPIRQVAVSRPANLTIKDYGEIKNNFFLIAKKAIELIEDNDVIFLSSTTVCFFMAQNLPCDKRIHVVTNSIIIAEELRNKEHVSVILLGGEMDHKGNCYDAFAISIVSKLRMDKSFICSAAISAQFGLSIQKSSAINFFNAVMDSSKKNIGLFPKEKIGFDSVVSICPAERLDILITDWEVTEEDLNLFREKEIEVIVVDTE